jgi:hypothetical protein
MAKRHLPALAVATGIIAGGIQRTRAQAEAIPRPCDRGDADRVRYFYSLSARVRPLLFWIGKDNVGGARIARSTRPVRRYELLIGSAPERTRAGSIAGDTSRSRSATGAQSRLA